nr:GTP-binding protein BRASSINAZOLE INSENSITIVE PALE GREEN 2, chloroplastic [Ipomoea batatas]
MERVPELGPWKERQIKATGTSWDVNSIDISVAGFGWLSLGLKGEADLTLWTYDGIEITLREALVLDRAPFLERPGFWLPKAISDAIGNQSKLEAQARKTTQDTLLSEVEKDQSHGTCNFKNIPSNQKPAKGLNAREIQPHLYPFRFFHEKDVMHIFDDGPWSYEQSLLILKQIKLHEDPESVSLNRAYFWVQIHGLPVGYSLVGDPSPVDGDGDKFETN